MSCFFVLCLIWTTIENWSLCNISFILIHCCSCLYVAASHFIVYNFFKQRRFLYIYIHTYVCMCILTYLSTSPPPTTTTVTAATRDQISIWSQVINNFLVLDLLLGCFIRLDHFSLTTWWGKMSSRGVGVLATAYG